MASSVPASRTELPPSPITGGAGTREDPFRIRACNATAARDVQLQLLRDIGRVRRWFWRTLSWSVDPDNSRRNSVLIETVEFAAESIATTQLRFFFDISEVEGQYVAPLPLSVFKQDPAGLTLPFELAWLHFDGSRNNAEESSATDLSFFYSGPAAKAAIYLYDKSPGARTRQDELKSVVSSISSDQISDPWPVAGMGPFLTKFLIAGQDITIAAVADYDPYFIKLRLTHADEPTLRQMMGEVIQALGDTVRSIRARRD